MAARRGQHVARLVEADFAGVIVLHLDNLLRFCAQLIVGTFDGVLEVRVALTELVDLHRFLL